MARGAKQELISLSVGEVSIVDEPANESPFLVVKRKEPVSKAALSWATSHPNGTPAMQPGAPWDGPAAVAAVPNEREPLERMHAFREDGADPDAKAGYKFPHHTSDGRVNLNALRAGLAALAGARGGAKIPESAVSGIEAHLRRHLRDDFDIQPTEGSTGDKIAKGEIRMTTANAEKAAPAGQEKEKQDDDLGQKISATKKAAEEMQKSLEGGEGTVDAGQLANLMSNFGDIMGTFESAQKAAKEGKPTGFAGFGVKGDEPEKKETEKAADGGGAGGGGGGAPPFGRPDDDDEDKKAQKDIAFMVKSNGQVMFNPAAMQPGRMPAEQVASIKSAVGGLLQTLAANDVEAYKSVMVDLQKADLPVDPGFTSMVRPNPLGTVPPGATTVVDMSKSAAEGESELVKTLKSINDRLEAVEKTREAPQSEGDAPAGTVKVEKGGSAFWGGVI